MCITNIKFIVAHFWLLNGQKIFVCMRFYCIFLLPASHLCWHGGVGLIPVQGFSLPLTWWSHAGIRYGWQPWWVLYCPPVTRPVLRQYCLSINRYHMRNTKWQPGLKGIAVKYQSIHIYSFDKISYQSESAWAILCWSRYKNIQKFLSRLCYPCPCYCHRKTALQY